MSPPTDVAVSVESLRAAGADRFDPVRFRFLEALLQRLLNHEGEVRRLLDARLATALADYQQRFAQHAARENAAPKSATDNPLRELLQGIAQDVPEIAESGAAGAYTHGPNAVGELKAVRQHRERWSRLSIDKQMRQAMKAAPENAGPLNSHWLVLRSLALMREIAPAYLDRFMAYADTLLWLDQAQQSKPPIAKPTDSAGSKRKPRSRPR